jgi:ribose transport system substrate-binding protein
VARLFDTGIPVIVLDRAVIGDKYTCFIAADPREIGTAAGKWIAGRLHGKGKLVELQGPVDSLWAQQLHAAWRAALRDPGFRFVFDTHVDPPKFDAGKLIGEALDRVREIDAVFAYDDAAAAAAYKAVKAAGREKGVLFVGVGGLPAEGAVYVSQGILDATFLNPTGSAEAVETAVQLFRGRQAPKKIVPPTRVITK